MKLTKTSASGVYYYESESKRYKGKPDRCFYIKYYKNGKQKQEKVGWLSDQFSVAVAARIRSKKLLDEATEEQKAITINEAISRYLTWAEAEKPASWNDDKLRLQVFKKDYGEQLITAITPTHIEDYISKIKLKKVIKVNKLTSEKESVNLSPATVRQYLQVVKRLFNYLADIKIYNENNPAGRIKLSTPDNTIVEALTAVEAAALVKVCNEYAFRDNGGELILFALFTGLRVSSIFRMKWDDIDRDRCMIRLKKTKNKKAKTLLVPESAIRLLDRIPVKSEYVFPSRYTEGQRQDIRTLWDKAKKLAGIRPHVRFHDLRHTYATFLVESGVQIDVVSKMLTHSSIQVTQKYAHVRDQRLQHAAQQANIMYTDKPARKLKAKSAARRFRATITGNRHPDEDSSD
ncbi:tyrosine-type recombinase/integrase [Geovibrio ferrireducens]|uniref:tyrosine-type recombinase/integrase n=1 Tax=Geovibrio ferrireducens TaxID=46201 RepID=UPI00224846A4|nr:site-specific integrase [Geovibrio ferrireducens]